MKNLKTFYSGKRVLVTGHTGFKGAWLCQMLDEFESDVFGWSLEATESGNSILGPDFYVGPKSELLDIRNKDLVTKRLKQISPEIVFHLAAQSLVIPSYSDPVDTYYTNVVGTACVLEAVRQTSSVKSVVVATSDKCYANQEWYWGYRESDRLGGYDPYSSSKACTELVVESYRNIICKEEARAHQIGIATVRSGNVVGGGDFNKDRLIPDIIRAVLGSKVLDLRYPDARRPWQHVLDPITGYLMLAERLHTCPSDYAEAWNFGPQRGNEKTVSQIVDYFKHNFPNLTEDTTKVSPAHETRMLLLDSSKSRARLGWTDLIAGDQIFELTSDWYKLFLQTGNASELTKLQARSYILSKEN